MNDSRPNQASLGVLSIATNIYLNYWMTLASSLDAQVRQFNPITLHVFTDQASMAQEFAKSLNRVKVMVHPIKPLGWPEATLFRFKIFDEHRHLFTEDYLLYLDADSIVDNDFEQNLEQTMSERGVLLVEQSGSWRPPRLHKKLRFYLLHPGAVYADLRKLIWEGGLGTWEKNPNSSAFVPRHKRKNYVFGAVWMGPREKLLALIQELAERVQKDWERGVIARWHDESHINWWNAEYQPFLLDPRYYFFSGQHHLDELPCIIRLVHKNEMTR